MTFTNLGSDSDELVPYTTGTSDNMLNHNSKKYKLFLVDEPGAIYWQVMGQGITFCCEYNCTVKHQGSPQRLNLKVDDLYVAQTKPRAFLKPTMASVNIDTEVVAKWLSMSQTLLDWSRAFPLGKSTLESESFATHDGLEAEKLSMRNARAYKTPQKGKLRQGPELNPFQSYRPFVPEEGEDPDMQAEKIMGHIDKTFEAMSVELLNLHEDQVILLERINKGSKNFDLRILEV